MSRVSPTQLALLKEMAESPDRHIIYDLYGLRTSWARGPGKRQILESTQMALEIYGLLQYGHIPGTTTMAWWLTPEGRALAATEGEEE